MKAGILTLHEADNYGAVLQAYALQTALTNLEAQSEFIIFEKEVCDKDEILNKQDKRLLPIADRILAEGKKRAALFDKFRSEYLKQSTPFLKKDASKLNDMYDLFIAGSDQIWNLNLPEVDGRYFLPFADPDKRYSYAASFGTEHISGNAKDGIQLLRNFNAISVREETGRKIIKKLTGRDSEVCLDPVFLLERKEWDKLCCDREGEPYIFLHMNQYHKALLKEAKMLAEEKHLKLCVATAGFMLPCGFQAWSGIGVTEWLSLIKNAEYIFTNSFHGIAFSLIYGRPFSAAELEGELSERNMRIVEILKKTGMEDCMKGKMLSISEQKLAERLSDSKQSSHKFLRNAISRAVCRRQQ